MRGRQEAAGPSKPACPVPSLGGEPPFSLGTYLRAVGFGVALHVLHGCQCVKAPNNPAAEGQGYL